MRLGKPRNCPRTSGSARFFRRLRSFCVLQTVSLNLSHHLRRGKRRLRQANRAIVFCHLADVGRLGSGAFHLLAMGGVSPETRGVQGCSPRWRALQDFFRKGFFTETALNRRPRMSMRRGVPSFVKAAGRYAMAMPVPRVGERTPLESSPRVSPSAERTG